jgi:3-oxoacyl-[acyl-carrier protein] reductase
VVEAEQTLTFIKNNNGTGELLPFDVSNKAAISEKLNGWIETHKEDHIEVLVNNAGIKEDVLMMWMKDEQWENVLRTNLDSFFYVTRPVLNDMLMKRNGRIVNVVSLSGLKGLPGQTNYSAAKGGVIAATKALAQEVGRRGITVNAVAPGFIKTDMTENISEKEMKAIIPVNRFGTPEEVAHVVAFLVSPESGYITGEVISINGGMYS